MDAQVVERLLDWVRGRHFGKYRGTVSDNNDPTKRGRLKVRVPAVLGDLELWAMPCVPYAGKGVGFYSLPEPKAGVWVEFEAGDPSFPVWTGCFWADGELPANAEPAQKIWKTGSLTLHLDDKQKSLVMEVKDGSTLTMNKDVISKSGDITHTVGTKGVVSKAGSTNVEVTSKSFGVNGGALEVV